MFIPIKEIFAKTASKKTCSNLSTNQSLLRRNVGSSVVMSKTLFLSKEMKLSWETDAPTALF